MRRNGMRYALVFTWFVGLAIMPGAGWGEEIAQGLARAGDLSSDAELLFCLKGLDDPEFTVGKDEASFPRKGVNWAPTGDAFTYVLYEHSYTPSISSWFPCRIYDLAASKIYPAEMDHVVFPHWSKDGQLLVSHALPFMSEAHQVQVINRSSRVVTQWDRRALDGLRGRTTPDIRLLVSGWRPGRSQFVLLIRGEGAWLATPQGTTEPLDWLPRSVSALRWSPSGRFLAMDDVRPPSGGRHVAVADFDTRQVQYLTEGRLVGWIDDDRLLSKSDGRPRLVVERETGNEIALDYGGTIRHLTLDGALVERLAGNDQQMWWVHHGTGRRTLLLINPNPAPQGTLAPEWSYVSGTPDGRFVSCMLVDGWEAPRG